MQGGHVDEGECIHKAALRELEEETGVSILEDDEDVEVKNEVSAVWESSFPTSACKGELRRHHIVSFFEKNASENVMNQGMVLHLSHRFV